MTKSASYREQIESRLERFVWPVIGTKTLSEAGPADVLAIIEALRSTPKTAEGVHGPRARREPVGTSAQPFGMRSVRRGR